MLSELIVFGGFWFWALTIVFSSWFLISTFREKIYGSTAAITIFLLVLTFFSNVNMFSYLYQNMVFFICSAIIYIIVGVGWSVTKWYLFNTKVKSTYNEIRNNFIINKHIDGDKIPSEHLLLWKSIVVQSEKWIPVTRYYDYKIPRCIISVKDIVPAAGSYKQQIIYWMMFWPLSLIFFFLSDFLERLFSRIYQLVSSIFVSISNRVFKSIQNDFVE